MASEAEPSLDGNDLYKDRFMENNERLSNLSQGAASENERLKDEIADLKAAVREAEYALKNNMKQFNDDKRKLEDKYQEAITEVNRLQFRVNDRKESTEKEVKSLKQSLAKAKKENDVLRFNCERFEVYLENEVKEDMKVDDQEEEKVNHELQKLEQAHQELLQAKEQAQNRLAETQKQRVKKRQDARKRVDMLKRVRNSKTRHIGLSLAGAANVSTGSMQNGNDEADGGSDLHAPLPAFDDGLEAELAVRPQHHRRESETSFGVDQQHDLFDDHLLGDIEGGDFDFDHVEEHSFEHTCISPSPTTMGKKEFNETDEEEKLKNNDGDEEMSEEPTAATKVPGSSATKHAEKKKAVKRHRTVKTKRDRRETVRKFRKKFNGLPIEKWSCDALKAECLYKKQKGDGAVPEKKMDLLAMYQIRGPRPSPPCSDAEDDEEERKEEEKTEEQVESKADREEKTEEPAESKADRDVDAAESKADRDDDAVERKDDHDDDDDTEIEDESMTEEYKAGEDSEEDKASDDDGEEYKPEEDDDVDKV